MSKSRLLAGAAKKLFLSLLTTLAIVGSIGTANARITYDVNRTVGAGSAVGFIETDGTIGILSTANIIDWSLTLTSSNLLGGSPKTITAATQIQTNVFGAGLSASLTALIFDFSVSDSWFFMQDGSGDLPFYGLGTKDPCGNGNSCVGEYLGWSNGFPGPAEVSSQTGRVSFATSSTVPEPSTIALLALSLFGLCFIKRNRLQ